MAKLLMPPSIVSRKHSQPHSLPAHLFSTSFGSSASKSPGTHNLPLSMPTHRFIRVGVLIATSFALGLPWDAVNMVSPVRRPLHELREICVGFVNADDALVHASFPPRNWPI